VIVLFHVTADTRWSDLPLSGAFVDMLKRIVALAGSGATPRSRGAGARETVRRPACSTASRVHAAASTAAGAAGYSFRATADHPPGFYGPPEGLLR